MVIYRDPPVLWSPGNSGGCTRGVTADEYWEQQYGVVRSFETIQGTVISPDGIVVVHAGRWLDPHPKSSVGKDTVQFVSYDTVLPDGSRVWQSEKRTARDAVRTARGLAIVARRWLRGMRA